MGDVRNVNCIPMFLQQKAPKSMRDITFFYAIPFLIKMVSCKWLYDTYKYYGYQSSQLK